MELTRTNRSVAYPQYSLENAGLSSVKISRKFDEKSFLFSFEGMNLKGPAAKAAGFSFTDQLILHGRFMQKGRSLFGAIAPFAKTVPFMHDDARQKIPYQR